MDPVEAETLAPDKHQEVTTDGMEIFVELRHMSSDVMMIKTLLLWMMIKMGGGGMEGTIFLNKPFGEQKTILHVLVGHVQHRPQGVQACTSLQESGTVLLASANKLIFA